MARSAARRRATVTASTATVARKEAAAAPTAGKVADLWLGIQLRALRKAKQMSLMQVAEAAGLSIGMVSQIERGLASPSIKSLRKLSDALGVPIGWFFHADAGRPKTELDKVVRRDLPGHVKVLAPMLARVRELLYEQFPEDEANKLELKPLWKNRREIAKTLITIEDLYEAMLLGKR